MVLSKALKAKLSLIPNGVTNLSRPSPKMENRRGLCSITRHGDDPACAGPVEGPSRMISVMRVCSVWLGSCGALGALFFGKGR